MTGILVIIAVALVVFILANVLRREGQPSDEERTQQLIMQAGILYPDLRLTDALDKLFEFTYKGLVAAKRRGEGIERFVRDHRLIVNERLRIWKEEVERKQAEIERESAFKILRHEERQALAKTR
jgi:hypothetical protein